MVTVPSTDQPPGILWLDVTTDTPVQLVVFSDDWGRHPSSCQHLTRATLRAQGDLEVIWVNTVGTRAVRFTLADAKKIARKLGEMFTGGSGDGGGSIDIPDRLRVVSPRMYPGFRSGWQRRLNARQMSKAVNAALGPRDGRRRVALTTLPITADLVAGQHALDIDRWVYYCVDDFSVWPGSDGQAMDIMERRLAPAVDTCLAVSQTLQERLHRMGLSEPPPLLTHGIDMDHWQQPAREHSSDKNRVVFWGLIDRRLDTAWVEAIGQWCTAHNAVFDLLGPTQNPDPKLADLPGVALPGPVDYSDLPAVAAAAGVLVMPYADLPVTRAMQPLKFKEYLATGKPVVARDLPAVKEWGGSADLVDDPEALVQRIAERIATGLPDDEAADRTRLQHESWDAKARSLWASIRAV